MPFGTTDAPSNSIVNEVYYDDNLHIRDGAGWSAVLNPAINTGGRGMDYYDDHL